MRNREGIDIQFFAPAHDPKSLIPCIQSFLVSMQKFQLYMVFEFFGGTGHFIGNIQYRFEANSMEAL